MFLYVMPQSNRFIDGVIIWRCRSKRCGCASCKEDRHEARKVRDRLRYRAKHPLPPARVKNEPELPKEPKQKKETYVSPYGNSLDTKAYYKVYYQLNREKLLQYSHARHYSKRTLALALSCSTACDCVKPLDANP